MQPQKKTNETVFVGNELDYWNKKRTHIVIVKKTINGENENAETKLREKRKKKK